ncbi:MAG: rod shape-determining protein RodA [Candidatus Latescibacterota bacterium]|nr:MAG: rod shape-determining protein RodA [Candidatus Latescibacterota bacterium]
MRATQRLAIHTFDWTLLGATLGIILFGLVVLYSASHTTGGAEPYHLRQLLWLLLGFAALGFGVAVPYRTLDFLAIPAYGLSLLLLIVLSILSAGRVERWIDIGPFSLQPSELAKISLVLIMARVLADRPTERLGLRDFLVPGLVAGVPFLLVLRQPDLGTALVFGAILVPMLFWAGLPERALLFVLSPVVGLLASSHLPAWIFYLVALLIVLLSMRSSLTFAGATLGVNMLVGIAGPILWNQMKDYQQRRILTFLDPGHDPLGAGYQIIQSEVAIGSGGLTGRGFMEGTQKGLSFLPEQHTDFIFSVVGEEFGFIGCVLLLFLFGLLLARILLIAARTRNRFASLLVIGFFGYLSFQVVINVGMTLGLVPVTGLPLPLFSYGGSSLTTTLFAIGAVLGVGLRKRRY